MIENHIQLLSLLFLMPSLARFPTLDVDIEKELNVLTQYAARLKPLVCDTVYYINTAIKQKKKIVVEGANAAMLDIDFGERVKQFIIVRKASTFL